MPLDEEGAMVPRDAPARRIWLIYPTPSNQYPMARCLSLARRLALIDHVRSARKRLDEGRVIDRRNRSDISV